ncbi:MAG TPA: SDR family oxidoreductase [Microbacterium sp.]|uniref:SDR family NAD(P)-dependent oxidoreductase n=1 Tax=Microbacterium sp. TaxID=51671 RepID=UPI002B6E6B24|nr:SDR family oxidoreductase [Microbacterium sp.]HWI30849.1 SDR family oxidoreductase [Microbacterium sp.]
MSQYTPPADGLQGRRVVVAGGTGAVGEGIVRSYLRTNAQVVVPTRSQSRLEEFRRILGAEGDSAHLTLLVADYSTVDGAAVLAEHVEQSYGPVTDVVASVGGWWAGPALWDTPATAWDEYFTGYATAHLSLAQAFMPRLTAEGAYHVIVGASAIYPVAGSGIVSMQQAALLMMGRVMQTEAGSRRRVFTHLLGYVNTRARAQQRPDWISAEEVGLLTATVSANPRLSSSSFELLDKSALEKTLADIQGTGVRA